ncbi:MBL fold metallo-hydrolase [Segetibacter aerophilus]|uniref:Hydrolase n=1 Tax=Segetibacter aerophilus TaxID=670293 RepID=A0A512BF72_9BACT|nr:MBL fold metallo-hydrolase [Segetibacter aerophilus]GEO10621.1 hydrolase [Segetibacter aerophilus]
MAYPSLTITFLGTGTSSGVPMIACGCEVCTSDDVKDTRLRSSIMVQSSTTTIIIDATPDFRYQMLREKVKKIDGLLITHPHKDHVAGIDDTRAFQFFNKRATDVFANKMTLEGVKKEIPYAFQQLAYPGVPKVNLHEITLEPFIIGDIPIIPILVWHHKMPVYGFRFGKFTYITDANAIDEQEQTKIKGSEIVVLNALRNETHISHFSLKEAIALVQQLNIPTAYFTHISHQLGLDKEVNSKLPKGMFLAFDTLQLFV